ncbi:MAG: methylated-DNA--[protein]-cysteine S-methyltransferase [Candidatus Eisenbacteria bacterium]|nr:methylated-DNA--[protein]-cysteine S-methyltransferase [Candidatus Eisenbacteria bacterium]
MMDSTITMPSPVGMLTLTASEKGLVAVLWKKTAPAHGGKGRNDTKSSANEAKQTRTQGADDGAAAILKETQAQLEEYFAGKRRKFDLPLDVRGTEFQKRVWKELQKIPFGETASYGDIAKRIGRVSACRAVGAANGRNPISIIVPCHRVIGANGTLTGFGGGLEAKALLLDHEARVCKHA